MYSVRHSWALLEDLFTLKYNGSWNNMLKVESVDELGQLLLLCSLLQYDLGVACCDFKFTCLSQFDDTFRA